MDRLRPEMIESLARFPEENPYPVLRISREGEILYANRAADPVIKIFACMVSKKLQGRWKELADQAFSDGQLRETEIGCQSQTFALSLAPVLGSDYLNVYGLDITERKRTEQALRQSEGRFRGIFEQSNDAILIIDVPGDRVVEANPQACRLLGFDHEQLLRQKPSQLHNGEAVEMRAFMDRVRDTGSGRTDELTCLTRDGRKVPTEISASMIDYAGERLTLVFLRDLTERKEAETKLQKAFAEVQRLKDRLLAENTYLQDEINLDHGFAEIVTQSAEMKRVLHQVEKVSATAATVLILGESGTGKELLARAVHEHSARRDRPLVKVNCAALPANLIESELFGHEKGAFTGAVAKKIGRFELADGGTLFLDEIGDLSLDLQAKLLRVLQEGEFERVGNPRTVKVDVRIIAATHRDLQTMAQEGDFREDLYYRLNVFPIRVPALRERREDVSLLVGHFVRKHAPRLGKHIESVPLAAQEALANYDWPGNVRELENVIERAIILSPGATLELGDFDRGARAPRPVETLRPTGTIKDMERTLILQALEAAEWRIEGTHGAARRLDMPASTLRERMKKYGLRRPGRKAA